MESRARGPKRTGSSLEHRLADIDRRVERERQARSSIARNTFILELWWIDSVRAAVTMKPVTYLQAPKVSTWRSASSGSEIGSDSIE